MDFPISCIALSFLFTSGIPRRECVTGVRPPFASAIATPAILLNNIFAGAGTITNQASAVLTSNKVPADGDPRFVNRTAYDYHLGAGSPAIDQGTAAGAGLGFSLTPAFQYVHPAQATARSVLGAAIDVGAYEHVP